eukprot:TRINITY_DN1065_c0_g1_i3.p1 TRINITY_DN1065_c0_g1~~TRINITY_DN1065_c0_g1_i3.p1  ORF type:complete len:161 (+),score=28.14 TRINITY_DN1065_c0_g1_i3:67-549(+)
MCIRDRPYCYYAAYGTNKGYSHTASGCLGLNQLQKGVEEQLNGDNLCKNLRNNRDVFSKVLGFEPNARLECGCTQPDFKLSATYQKFADNCLKNQKNSCYYVAYTYTQSNANCVSIKSFKNIASDLTSSNFCTRMNNDKSVYSKYLSYEPKLGVECGCNA